jgi:transcriptional regulator
LKYHDRRGIITTTDGVFPDGERNSDATGAPVVGRKDKTLLYGTLDVLILKTLSVRTLHGYGIARWLAQTSGGRIKVDESSLYPALYRLQEKGLLESEWGRSELDRRAKFYRLTDAGKSRLARESTEWADFADAVSNVLWAAADTDLAPEG